MRSLEYAATGLIALVAACSGITTPGPASADPSAIVGTWTIRYREAPMGPGQGSYCILDPNYPDVGCLGDTLYVNEGTGSISIIGIDLANQGPTGQQTFMKGAANVALVDFINAPPAPRCSGFLPPACWRQGMAGVTDSLYGDPIAVVIGDSIQIGWTAWAHWINTGPPFTISGGAVIGPPYTHGYDSSRFGVVEMTRR